MWHWSNIALNFVVAAGVAYGITVWIDADETTFGPQGDGTALLKEVSGPQADPESFAQHLRSCSYAMTLLAVGLVASGLRPPEKAEAESRGPVEPSAPAKE